MTDSKLKKQQERAQAAAFDLFNTLTRLGIWQCNLVMGKKLVGEFESLTVTGMYEASMLSDLDNVMITLKAEPEKTRIEIETTPEGQTTTEVENDG